MPVENLIILEIVCGGMLSFDTFAPCLTTRKRSRP